MRSVVEGNCGAVFPPTAPRAVPLPTKIVGRKSEQPHLRAFRRPEQIGAELHPLLG